MDGSSKHDFHGFSDDDHISMEAEAQKQSQYRSQNTENGDFPEDIGGNLSVMISQHPEGGQLFHAFIDIDVGQVIQHDDSQCPGGDDQQQDDIGMKDLTNSNARQTGILPPMAEEAALEEDDLYICFESAAYAYRARKTDHIDRILVLKASARKN